MKIIAKAVTCIIVFITVFTPIKQAVAYENIFSGVYDQSKSFYDVSWTGGSHWAKDAVYEMAAFGIVRGFEGNVFRPDISVSRTQALAFIYRALAREEEAALRAGEIADLRSKNPDMISSADVWADGYLVLAMQDGLITKEQYDQAMSPSPWSYDKTAPASRQEIAFWIAKAFQIEPSYDYSLFNTYADSGMTSNEIRPFLSALVNRQIIKGANGYLNPQNPVTRAEISQILINCESDILRTLGLAFHSGAVSRIPSKNVVEIGMDVIVLNPGENLMVLSGSNMGGAELLRENDMVTYYTNSENRVVFVKVTGQRDYSMSQGDITSGVVYSVNSRSIVLYDESGKTDPSLMRSFTISGSVTVLKNGQISSLSEISPNDRVFLKLTGGLVTEISFAKSAEAGPVTTETANIFVYKAVFDSYDSIKQTILVREVMSLEDFFWGFTPQKGILTLKIDSLIKIFNKNGQIFLEDLHFYPNSEIILATAQDLDNSERAIFIRIADEGQPEVYSGEITVIDSMAKRAKLQDGKSFNIGEATIIIKNGRVAAFSEVSRNDAARIAAAPSGIYNDAYAVYIDDSLTWEDTNTYFARIVKVNVGESIMVETVRSYDPKRRNMLHYSARRFSLRLTGNTRILGENGIVNNRDFSILSRGEYYLPANIVEKNGEALVISLESGAESVLTGRVGAKILEEGKITGVNIYSVFYYISGRLQNALENGPLYFKKNTIFMKHGKPVQASDIQQSDNITVFYTDIYDKREALIVFIE